MPKVARVGLAVLVAMFACLANASLKEARESIVGSLEHSAIATLRLGPFNIPDELGKNDLVLIVTAGARFGDVLLLGPVSGDAKGYAQALDDWQGDDLKRNGTVLWSQEDDYACARLTISDGKFGARSGKMSLPLGDLVARLKTRYQLMPVLRVSRGAHLDPKPVILGGLTKGFVSYDLAQVSPTYSATLTRHLSNEEIGETAIFFGLLDVVLLISFAIAYAVGKSNRIPIPERRKLYTKLATWPIFGALAIHAPLALFYIQSPTIRSVADLWFGTSRVSSAGFPILMSLPLMMMCLPIMKGVEVKLFGPSQPSGIPAPLAKPPALTEGELAFRKRRGKVSLIFVAAGAAVAFYGLFLSPPNARHIAPFINMAGMLLIFLSTHIASLFLKKETSEFEAPVADSRLTGMAEGLARGMDAKLGRVVIDRRPSYRNFLTARISLNGEIRVSQRAASDLNGAELRFLLAHEIGHRKAGHLRQIALCIFPAFILVEMPVVGLMAGRQQLGVPRPGWWLPLIFAAPMAALGWILIGSKAMRRKQEFEADRLAVEETHDPDSAVSVLRKIAASSSLPDMHEVETLSTHPSISARVAAIREIGMRNGYRMSTADADRPPEAGEVPV